MSPKTGKWEETHMKKTVTPSFDKKSHVYTLVLSLKSRFEIFIDMESKMVGDLLRDMEPSVNPPKEIPDPTDLKPEDWVDNETMPDPKDLKPADWDDDAPKEIVDAKDKKPYGWEDDAPFEIPDPTATKPEAWNEEEDGVWTAPMIQNPDYKGKWSARTIPNPDFFEDKTPSDVPKFDAVGFEIWTMQGGIIFDNIVIAKNVGDAFAYATATWKERKTIENVWYAPPKPKIPPKGPDWTVQVWRQLEEWGLDGWQGALVGVGLLALFAQYLGLFDRSAPEPTEDAKEAPKEGADDKNGTEKKETDKAEGTPKEAQAGKESELRNRKAAGLNLNED